MAVLKDDEICSYIVTEAKMASRSNLVEHVNLAIDIETAGKPSWGTLDTTCGFNMMGMDTYEKWKRHDKDAHSITLQTIPYHNKYWFAMTKSARRQRASSYRSCWATTTASFSCAWFRARPRFCCPRRSSWN